MSSAPTFSSVRVPALANVYFDGGVVSHTLYFPDGSRKTLGLIRPGTYAFNTAAAEIMEITAGNCVVIIGGVAGPATYGPGTQFEVPANSSFTIQVEAGICQYICSFLEG